ncbi:MAG: ATP-binding cassette domain-containing protein [Desulfovibrionales bacterium]|nr:ATP-binding cassette domain-containing protein [Desulfovibrionales bacterium]
MNSSQRSYPPAELVSLHGASVTYGAGKMHESTVLHELSLKAYAQTVTGILGPDGAGKTTLLRLLAGLLLPSSGSATVLGDDVTAESELFRQNIGYMPQQFGLYEDLSVHENLRFYADMQGVPHLDRATIFHDLMTLAGLERFADRKAGDLSGGMKQKLGLACCLVKTPQLLLLDEPTVGVDPIARRDLWQIIQTLVSQKGIGVVVSTAYLDEAERCDTVFLLHNGKILEQGTPQSFSETMQGRVAELIPTKDYSVRYLHADILHLPEVIDCSIHSGKVRLVTRSADTMPQLVHTIPQIKEVKSVPPCFEDAFMERIHALEKDDGQELLDSEQQETGMASAPRTRSDTPVVISVSGLKKKFGSFLAVDDINFSVHKGEIFGLLGANGAGKTTTFRMLCGLLNATSGEIRINNRSLIKSPAELRKQLGYMAQKFSLYKPLTVEGNLQFYGSTYGLGKKQLNRRIEWALAEFSLTTKRKNITGELSTGQKQRLAMAAAMLHAPPLLFLDEPTSGADPLARREFWAHINKFSKQGVTVIVTTHFMEEAEYCDTMLIMSQGKMLASGSPSSIRELARSPQNNDPTVEDAFIRLIEQATADQTS